MRFNLHHGQVRISQGKPYEVPKGEKLAIVMLNPDTGKTVEYATDDVGVVEIEHPAHIVAMSKLGWPIDDGSDGKGGRKLIWNDQKNSNELMPVSEYSIRLYEALQAQGK